MNRAETLFHRVLVVVVAFMWSSFFGTVFRFTPLMVVVVALMSIFLLRFWD